MRIENARMQTWLRDRGIEAMPKFLWDGSMKRTWRLYSRDVKWSQELIEKFNSLGFTDYDGTPLDTYSGNGGGFQVFVRHAVLTPEFTEGVARP